MFFSSVLSPTQIWFNFIPRSCEFKEYPRKPDFGKKLIPGSAKGYLEFLFGSIKDDKCGEVWCQYTSNIPEAHTAAKFMSWVHEKPTSQLEITCL